MNTQSLFLDDFFAECEDHIRTIQHILLELESGKNFNEVDDASLETLFRCLHSIKGNCGMVGLSAGEELSHGLEDYVRLLKDGTTRLTGTGLKHLSKGMQTLEQVVEAFSAQGKGPETAPLLNDLRNFMGSQSPNKRKSARKKHNHSESSAHSGPQQWKFSFQPTPALNARGINVNTVRARLLALGTLLETTPRMLPEGGVAFDFTVATTAPEAQFLDWRDEGISCTAIAGEPIHETLTSSTDPTPAVERIHSTSLVRVDITRLDAMMQRVGDVVVSGARLNANLERTAADLPQQAWRTLQESMATLERHLRSLREDILQVRMVPLRAVFDRLRLVVLNLKNDLGINAKLEITGESTEIDKALVDRLMDPLLHLIRNAMTHGLESSEERVKLGKPPEGLLKLRAMPQGESVIIEVEDDGRGLDQAAIIARAHELNIAVPKRECSASDLLDILYVPGFSMHRTVDHRSGRGVGMDVVKTTLSAMSATLSVRTEPGRYTCFTLRIPLTLSITDALIVLCGTQRYAIPRTLVQEVIEVTPGQIKAFENNEIVPYRAGVLPILRLARFFGFSEVESDHYHAFVLGEGGNAKGILVQRVVGVRPIVVRPLLDPLTRIRGINGATEIGDGQTILILDAAALV